MSFQIQIDLDCTKNWLSFEMFKSAFEKKQVVEYENQVIDFIPKPLVTVWLLTYNHVNYIKESIESVLCQKTDFDWELIIADDGSSDGTREICIDFAKKFSTKIRLFLHHRENNIKVFEKPCGIFPITHFSFSSRGKYMAGLSGDDFWQDENKLQKQFDFMEANPDFAYCYHDWQFYYEQKHDNDKKWGEISSTNRIQTLFYRNIFKKIPLEFLEVLQEDTFIKHMLFTYGNNSYISDIKPSVVRIHENNLWGESRNASDFDFQANSRVYTWNKIKKAYSGSKFEEGIDHMIKRVIEYDQKNRPQF